MSVDSEAELDEIFQKAVDANLYVGMIVDAGLTEFNANKKANKNSVGCSDCLIKKNQYKKNMLKITIIKHNKKIIAKK